MSRRGQTRDGNGRTLFAQYTEDGANGVLIFMIQDMFGAVNLDPFVMPRGSRDDVCVYPIFEDLNCELTNRAAYKIFPDDSEGRVRTPNPGSK